VCENRDAGAADKEPYRAIVIGLSQKDRSVLRRLRGLGRKRVFGGLVNLYKLEVPAESAEEVIEELQRNLRDRLCGARLNFYFHLYRNDELVVVFKDAVFRVSVDDRSGWTPLIEHGTRLGIPPKQLDFVPRRIQDETY
jgi:hypothetical protein